MKGMGILHTLLLCLALTVIGGISLSCSEKSAPPPSSSNNNDKQDGSGDDTGDDDSTGGDEDGSGGDDDAGASSFDLCKALTGSKSLKKWDSLIEDFCQGSGDHSLKDLRANYYKGGSSVKLTFDAEEESGNTTAIRLSGSMLVDAKVTDYWNMERMRFFKPSEFNEMFDVQEDTEYRKKSGDLGDSKVSYEYENQRYSPEGVVRYEAETTFVVLKKGKAYAIATEHTKPIEGVKELLGLIIFADKGGKTESFSLSEQKVDNAGDHEATVSRAKESAADEQKRSFNNAKKADKATDALGSDAD